MTRSRPVRRAVLGVTVTTLAIMALTGVQAGSALAAEDTAEAASGKTPKQLKGLKLDWYADPAESKQHGATMPAYGDMVAVGVALTKGNSKTRKQMIKQAGKKDTTIGPATKTGKKDTVANVVVNLAGKVPGKLKSDVVLVVGADGKDSVPFSVAAPDSYTQGSAFAHVIGRYGSQTGAPWLTGDDTLAGDAPGSHIDFERQGTGAGGYDAKTKSIYTSFILPSQAQNLHISLYTTEGGTVQTDMLSGPAHTFRVPVHGMAVDPVTCAKLDVFGRADKTGTRTGIYDVRATLVQPLNGTVPSSPQALVLVADAAASPASELSPESPAGSGITYWQGTVDVGSPDGGVFEVTALGTASGPLDDQPLTAVSNAFGGVRVQATPDSGGTAYGDAHCGTVFEFEGCTHGGGAEFWGDFVEALGQPRPTGELLEFPFTAPLGTAYCVIVEDGQEQPHAITGIEPRPFTHGSHVRDMEANVCDQTPVDIGYGGVVADCEGGPLTFRWLETGLDPASGVDPGWGFRPEFTILPTGREALGWVGDFPPPTPESMERTQQEMLRMLAEAGWTGDEEGYDFSREDPSLDASSDDLIAD